MLRQSLGALALSLHAVPSLACDIVYDPRPTWEEMVAAVDVVFVGEVIAIVPDAELGDLALFRVDKKVKGSLGDQLEAVTEVSSCTRSFGLGDNVLFAGSAYATDRAEPLYHAMDSGWDPTMILTDPPTLEQQLRLDYLMTLAEARN